MENKIEEPKEKCKCGNDPEPMHECPYKVDVYNNYAECNCCQYCKTECWEAR